MIQGYWEPHTSSVDFCESNYSWSRYVAEPHNVWSSWFGISLWGLLGLWQTLQGAKSQQQQKRGDGIPTSSSFHPLYEWRTRLAFWLLLLIGIGSMGLHGTLHWIFQSSDELPMVYVVLCGVFSLLEIEARPHHPKFPLLPYAMAGVSVLQTVIYYVFQEYYIVFLVTFSVGVAFVVQRIGVLATSTTLPVQHSTRRLARLGFIAFVPVAIPVWIFDMLLCDHGVLQGSNLYFAGMTPHVVWHFCAGFGAYCLILFMIACRCDLLCQPVRLAYWCKSVPVLRVVDEKVAIN